VSVFGTWRYQSNSQFMSRQTNPLHIWRPDILWQTAQKRVCGDAVKVPRVARFWHSCFQQRSDRLRENFESSGQQLRAFENDARAWLQGQKPKDPKTEKP
jgi:hypothetical protein